MKNIFLTTLLLLAPVSLQAAEKAAEQSAPAPQAEGAKAPAPETVDISDLEEDYWRPNKDQLEVVQNRRFEKAGRFELAAHYGFFQGEDFKNSRALGVSAAFNLTNQWFVEASYLKVNAKDNDFVASLARQYNFRPAFNYVDQETALQVGWVPIYAKFSLLGEKISHFELYLAAGAGAVKTVDTHFAKVFTVGNKFYITEHLLFRFELRMTNFTDKIYTSVGSTSTANGGPGFVEQGETKHDMLFGLGWMF